MKDTAIIFINNGIFLFCRERFSSNFFFFFFPEAAGWGWSRDYFPLAKYMEFSEVSLTSFSSSESVDSNGYWACYIALQISQNVASNLYDREITSRCCISNL